MACRVKRTASAVVPGWADGFTLLEIIIALFLIVGVLTLIVPRFAIGEDLGAAGRKFIGAVRTFQGMAMASQKPLKLYIDLDQGLYWAVVLNGKEEKPLPDATWVAPRALPETIRFTDISIGQVTRRSGRIDLALYPTGRIDAGTFHLMDGSNSVLAIVIEPVTGAIRTSDERIEVAKKPSIPDRVKGLLQPAAI